jgi:uncharacterized DUF497 family protein
MGCVNQRQFLFDWDEIKAAANVRKHGISFDLARTVFNDAGLLSIPELEHSADDGCKLILARSRSG